MSNQSGVCSGSFETDLGLQPARDSQRARVNASSRLPGWESVSVRSTRPTSTAASLSRRERLYVSTLLFVALLATTPRLLPSASLALPVAFILTSWASVGALLTRRPWVGALEAARLLGLSLALHFQSEAAPALMAGLLGQTALLVGFAMRGGDRLFGSTRLVDAQQVDALDGWAQ